MLHRLLAPSVSAALITNRSKTKRFYARAAAGYGAALLDAG